MSLKVLAVLVLAFSQLSNAKMIRPTDALFVKGDPFEVIKGATLNKESFLDVQKIESYSDFNMSTFMTLAETEKEKKEFTNMDEVREDNKASEENHQLKPAV